MFHNLSRHVLQKGVCNSGVRNVLHQNMRKTSSNSNESIKSDLEIGASLFENSRKKHEPIASSEELIWQQKRNHPLQIKNSVFNKPTTLQKEEKVIHDTELGLEFYRDSKFLSTILTIARSHKQRDKKRKIIIEGRRLISEAIKCNLHLENLVFSQRDQLLAIKEEVANAQRVFGSKIYKISQHELKMWSILTRPPGLLAVFERPSENNIVKANINSKPLPITVVCDNIREPSNLGSIIRTCAALPCSQLITTNGCCDPWESKTLRGGCGGHFRLLIRDDVSWSDLDKWIPSECQNNYRVFIAENNFNKALLETEGNATDYQDIGPIGAHNIIFIGGETSGVSSEAYKFVETIGQSRGKCLFIPLANGIDSLNVASALTLILYEFRSQLIRTQLIGQKLNNNEQKNCL